MISAEAGVTWGLNWVRASMMTCTRGCHLGAEPGLLTGFPGYGRSVWPWLLQGSWVQRDCVPRARRGRCFHKGETENWSSITCSPFCCSGRPRASPESRGGDMKPPPNGESDKSFMSIFKQSQEAFARN